MFEALILAAALQGSPACQTAGACRRVEGVTIRRQGAEAIDVGVGRELPWIDSNNILGLYLGDVAVVRLEGETAVAPKLVATGPAATAHSLQDGELRAQLVQGEDFKIRLKVESRLGKPIHFNLVESLIAENDEVAGTQEAPPVCPVAAKSAHDEVLTGLITRVGLMGFTYTDRTDCYTELRRR